jgi:hypothetical protein
MLGSSLSSPRRFPLLSRCRIEHARPNRRIVAVACRQIERPVRLSVEPGRLCLLTNLAAVVGRDLEEKHFVPSAAQSNRR